MSAILRSVRAVFSDRMRMIEQMGGAIDRIGRVKLAGGFSAVFIKAPKLVSEVFIENADEFQKGRGLRVVARPLLGDGLLTSEGEAHRRRRKLMAPAFAHQRVSKYAPMMEEYCGLAQVRWRDGERLDIAQEMMRLTLRIIGKTLFDIDMQAQADALGRDITAVQKHFGLQVRVPFQLPFQWRAEAAARRLDQTIYGLIRERRESGSDRGDLLSMLLLSTDEETGQHLTDKEIRDEAMTLFLAGHETTAQAMAWSWYLLAQDPPSFVRLRAEGLPFALRVMKEAMRLYPPAWVIGREALREIEIGGFTIRKNELVLVAPWLMHRDAGNFEDPLRFDPDRFLPEREARIPKFAYLPFGAGKRICIGNQFALLEGQIILASLARQVSMELASARPVRPEPLVTLRPKGGVRVQIRRL